MREICVEVHKFVNSLPKYEFPLPDEKLPLNGIYFLFEKGEAAHNGARIVRIGTHTGSNQLRSRLKQHFVDSNKDRSIFRKNIGRAILNQENDPFLKKWEIDLTPSKARRQFSFSSNFSKQQEVEQKITERIRDNFTFALIEIRDEKMRLDLESKIISAVSLCEECLPSPGWLGHFSPKPKIRESGLWQVNELYKTPLTLMELEKLKKHN